MQPDARLLEGESRAPSAPEERFSNFYRRHYWQVLAFAQRRINNHETARDLASETFRVAWTKFEQAEHLGLAFLYQTCKNLIGNEYRRQLRVAALEVKLQHCPERHAGDKPSSSCARPCWECGMPNAKSFTSPIGRSLAPSNWPTSLAALRKRPGHGSAAHASPLRTSYEAGSTMPKQLFEDETRLDAGIRNANPFPVDQVPELDQRALNDLASILAAPPVTNASTDSSAEPAAGEVEEPVPGNIVALNAKRKTTRRWVLGALAAVAAGVLVAVPLGSALDGTTKATASPMPLEKMTQSTVGTKEALGSLIKAVDSSPDPAGFDPGRIDIGHWEGGAYGDGGIYDDRLSIPTFNEHRVNPDGSSSIRQTIGEPFSLTGESVKYNRKNLMDKPGTVINYEFAPGEQRDMFDTTLGRTAEAFYSSIHDQLRPDSAAVNDGPQGFLQIMGFVMMDRRLDQAESASLLGALTKLEGLKVIGTTTDRWDREAVAFGVETPTDGGMYRTTLMFNPATGRLTNYMEEFLVDDAPETRGDFNTSMVTRYIAISE
jgi:hypothetical protein